MSAGGAPCPQSGKPPMNRDFDHSVLTRDHDGRAIVLVPLAYSSERVKLLPDDYDKLVLAGVSAEWTRRGTEGRYVYCGSRREGDLAIVARLIVGAGPGGQVNYHDGNRLNLRKENLWIRHVSVRKPVRAIFEDTSAALSRIWQRRAARRKCSG